VIEIFMQENVNKFDIIEILFVGFGLINLGEQW